LYTVLEEDEKKCTLTRHKSHIGNGRHDLIRHVVYLPNSTKKTINRIFSKGFLLH
jgi:hypothetical protein